MKPIKNILLREKRISKLYKCESLVMYSYLDGTRQLSIMLKKRDYSFAICLINLKSQEACDNFLNRMGYKQLSDVKFFVACRLKIFDMYCEENKRGS